MKDNTVTGYKSVARSIENDILTGKLRENSQVPSTHEAAEIYGVNPATAARGISLLTNQSLLNKKRGIGMFVVEGAREIILKRRLIEFKTSLLADLISEAAVLGISKANLSAMIASL